jgi:hypothetical protein
MCTAAPELDMDSSWKEDGSGEGFTYTPCIEIFDEQSQEARNHAKLLDISPMASAYNQYYLPFLEIHEPRQFAKVQQFPLH